MQHSSKPFLQDGRVRLIAMRALLFVALLAVWQLGSLGAPSYILPGPAKVFGTWTRLIQTTSFWGDFGITFYRIAVGFLFAAVTGAALGLVLGSNKALGEFLQPVLVIINTVSSSIWAIFALIWFGLSDWSTIFVVYMTAMPLILTNVWEGTRTVSPEYLELVRTFRMPKVKVLTTVYLPTILPLFFAGARLAFGFGARVSIVAEALGATSGIGYRLRQAADLVQTDQVFAWTMTLVILMIFVESTILKPLERRLFSWRERNAG